MPWQESVLEVASEILPNGRPAYRTIVFTVPRQNGKTTVVLVATMERLLMRGAAQKVIYTAQSGTEGRQKFVEDWMPALKASPLDAAVERYYQAADNTGLVLKNGSRMRVAATDDSSGHGKSIDMAVLDETFRDRDDAREQAFRPAMRTRPQAQMWIMSTAGDAESTFLRDKIETGRVHVEDGSTTGVAYTEYSAADEADPDAPATWAGCNPALGHTIDLDVIASDRASMSDGGFRRSALNQWTTVEDAIIPAEVWALVRVGSGPEGRITLAVDAAPDQSSASIAAADRTGRAVMLEHRADTDWLTGRVAELARQHRARVAVGTSGPVAYLIDDLPKRSVRVTKVPPGDVAKACARFYDLVADRACQIAPTGGHLDDVLDAARAAARRRTVGGGWMWAPSPSQDVSPLMAVTLAVSVAQSRPDPLSQIQ